MSEYVLILLVFWTNPAVTNIDHLTKAQCESMGNQAVKDMPNSTFHVRFVCLEKREERK